MSSESSEKRCLIERAKGQQEGVHHLVDVVSGESYSHAVYGTPLVLVFLRVEATSMNTM